MNTKIITNIKKFIEELILNYAVYGPTKDGFIQFEDTNDINICSENTLKAPKEIFFPQTEVMFTYQKDKKGEAERPVLNEKRILLGVKPCDVKSFLIMDRLFDNDDYKDPYYIERRRSTVIMGIACLSPKDTCFCNSFDISLDNKEAVDILLTDIGGRYLTTGISDKGSEIIDNLEKASQDDIKKAEEVIKKAKDKLNSKVSLTDLSNKLKKVFEDDMWKRMTDKCLGCATCTYLCPTCHCFDVQDENLGKEGRRVRLWDSCQFPLFTLHTSGHNPREHKSERIRNRVMHKFSYFKGNFGEIACVGCGRCVENCPVNFDIREMLEMVSSK
ncbi:MAG: 4Fe-4S dicluster domain-containing protein [bacterium]|nr:4Fe-4S dicluster domain-containing protein [bacterium]